MLKLTIYHGPSACSRKLVKGNHTVAAKCDILNNYPLITDAIQANTRIINIEGLTTSDQFRLLAFILVNETIQIKWGTCSTMLKKAHIIVTTNKPPDYFTHIFKDVPNVSIINCDKKTVLQQQSLYNQL